jgi:hypothetical protein
MANDYLAYINRYPDLKAAFGSDVDAGKKHYEEYGQKEGRDASISGGDTSTNFDLDRFESLLSRLEASKGRQQRQKSVEGRRDIFSQGLAGMMSNF